MKAASRKEIGNRGESHIEKYLLKEGWKILAQNYFSRNPLGQRSEIDLIAFDPLQKQLVFVEVRVRLGQTYLPLSQSLHNQSKKRALIRGARAFLQEIYNGKRCVPHFCGIRFDFFYFQNGQWSKIPSAITV